MSADGRPTTISRRGWPGGLSPLLAGLRLPIPGRADKGPESVADALRRWSRPLVVSPLFTEPGSRWESGYVESFIGKLRDACLKGEGFSTSLEAQVVTGQLS